MVRAKSTRPAPVKKKAVAKPVRRTTQRKAKKKPQREMPSWLRYVIAGIIAFLFLAAFFYFFIRPYSYRWKPCYGFKAYGVCMPSGFPKYSRKANIVILESGIVLMYLERISWLAVKSA